MKILSTKQIRKADDFTIKNEPISSIDLMERASQSCTDWIIKNFNKNQKIKIFVGQGNNGGDGLAIARQLKEKNFFIEVFIMKISENYSDDFKINLLRLEKQNKVKINFLENESNFKEINKNDIIIDALFGSGLKRKLENFPAKILNFLNNLEAKIISIDIPSGLFAENNEKTIYDKEIPIIKANFTLSFQFPKLSFFFPETEKFVKEYFILNISLHKKFIENIETKNFFLKKDFIFNKIKKRNRFSHKGNFGHGLLIAGSYGKFGACVLAAKSCLKTGIGLLSTQTPKFCYSIIQISVPESMVILDNSNKIFTNVPNLENYSAIGIGSGIGMEKDTENALEILMKKLKSHKNKRLVIDADAINLIAKNSELLKIIPENAVLTPHIKEFERLIGKKILSNFHRYEILKKFSKKYKVFIVLKGQNTIISCPDGICYFNTTGNPGMATAGSGDVLTGMILSFLAQNYEIKDAVILGVYLHGLAGDFAKNKVGENSLTASDIIKNIKNTFPRN